MASEKVMAHLEANRDRHVEQLSAFLSIPSVSSQSDHAADVRRAAEFVAAELK